MMPGSLLFSLARIRPNSGSLWLAPLMIWVFASSTWSFSPELTDEFSKKFAATLLATLTALTVVETTAILKRCIMAISLGTIVCLIQFVRENGWNIDAISGESSVRATIEGINANYFAYTIATACGLCFILLDRGASLRERFSWFVVCLLSGSVIAMSGSRGALIGVLMAALWVAYRTVRPQGHYVARCFRILYLLLPVFAITGIVDERFRPETVSARETGDLNGRLRIWPMARQFFWDHPIRGIGAGTFEFESGLGFLPHNSYLTFAAELGLVGLTLFCMSIWLLGVPTKNEVSTGATLPSEIIALINAPLLYSGVWDRSPVFWISLALIFRSRLQPVESLSSVPTNASPRLVRRSLGRRGRLH